MRRKMLSILFCMLLISSSLIIIQQSHEVTAHTGNQGETSLLNMSYAREVADNLSRIINTSYNQTLQEKGLAKGRYFGSQGEHDAADYLSGKMQDIGLISCANDDNKPFHERIENASNLSNNNLNISTTQFDVLAKSFTITDNSIGSTMHDKPIDCYISPRNTNDSPGNWTPPLDYHDITPWFNWTDIPIYRTPFPLIDWLIKHFESLTLTHLWALCNMTDDEVEENLTESLEHYYNFSFDDIAAHPENITHLSWYNSTDSTFIGDNAPPFFFIRENKAFNPNNKPLPLRPPVFRIDGWIKNHLIYCVRRIFPSCKAEILYDHTNTSHACPSSYHNISQIFINRTVWNLIKDHLPSCTASLHFHQEWNESVKSYNIIGKINGSDTNQSHVIVINSLYDSVWSSGTADSAIAVGVVLALAHYYKDLENKGIKPKYTIQFVLFGGEEAGCRGAKSYRAKHKDYTIEKFIDLNQLGFNQTYPKTTLNIGTNRIELIPILQQIAAGEDYKTRTKNTIKLDVIYRVFGLMSDDFVYSIPLNNKSDTITFLKDTTWYRHHRDGVNHTEGDSMKYYNDTDVAATADLILNFTKYFCLNPNCIFDGAVNYTAIDTPYDSDNKIDTVRIAIPLKSTLPQDLVRVEAELIRKGRILPSYTEIHDFTITSATSTKTINLTLPPNQVKGDYSVKINVYNSTGRINSILDNSIWYRILHLPYLPYKANATDTSLPTYFYLYPRGNDAPNKPSTPAGPTTVKVGQKHTWSSTASDPNHDRVMQEWFWDYPHGRWLYGYLDDGSTRNASHIYLQKGSYTIKVKAWDEYLASSPLSEPLTVNVIPWVNIDPQQQTHQSNSLHLLQNCEQYFIGNQVGGDQYYWTFGDQSFETATTPNAAHTYTQVGNYNLTLEVTDSLTQLKGNNTIHIRVTPLVSNFNMSYYHSAYPETPITFTNISKGISPITNLTWNFDDGTIVYGNSTVNHTFEDDGDYNVTLTVRDNQDRTDTDYAIIHITSYPQLPEIPFAQEPGTVLPGSNATIITQVIPTDRNITSITVNITIPNGTTQNITMTNFVDDIYTYTLENITQSGQYNYTIYATDSENQTNSSTGAFTLLQPYISFEAPTPDTNAILNHNWVHVNTSILDPYPTASFIDWNHSLKGYWSMDAYNDTYLYDSSPYLNVGTYHNGINASNITTGKYGNGLNFTSNGGYIDLGNDTSLNLGTGDFTFTVWEKSNQNTYPGTAVILSNQPENANWNGYIFGVKNTPYLATINGQNTSLNGTINVTDNSWHHLAYVRNGNTLRIYVDGTPDGEITSTLRNITNDQTTCFSRENHPGWCHFDGILDEALLFNRALSRDEINTTINSTAHPPNHNYTGLTDSSHCFSAYAIDSTGNQSTTEERQITIDTHAPWIANISANPATVGFGYNVTIQANVADNLTGLNTVKAVITGPESGGGQLHLNETMIYTQGNIYQYVFTDSYKTGSYTYSIYAVDNASNAQTKTNYSFTVAAHATLTVSTLKDSYSGNEYINLTDPPSPPENYTLVDRGLDWDKYYDPTLDKNILEISSGPINYQNETSDWTPINTTLTPVESDHPAYTYGYRVQNDRGLYSTYFKPNLQSDWPIAFAYNRSQVPTIDVLRTSIIGVGYVDPSQNWRHVILQGVQNSQGQTNGNTITYPGAFNGVNVTYTYDNTLLKEEVHLSNTTKTYLQTHPPASYGLSGNSYLIFATKLDLQSLTMHNGTMEITDNITIPHGGIDLKDALGRFACALPIGEAYEENHRENTRPLTYRVIRYNGEWYLLSGLPVSTLSSMTFPVVIDPSTTLYSNSSDGHISASNTNYNTAWTASQGTISDTNTYFNIGQRKVSGVPGTYYVYRGFLYFNSTALQMSAVIDTVTLSLYKYSDYSTTDFLVTVQNGQPTYPDNPLKATDYDKSHYSGNGGQFNTNGFTTGYNAITLNSTGQSWINQSGWTRLCLRSSRDISGTTPTGSEYIGVYSSEQGSGYQPKLVITYRNQSKIQNTGTTDIKGHLLIEIQFHNPSTGQWITELATVNETIQTITHGQQLGLDTIYNGQAKTNDLQHGDGTYRIYTAFRDPQGNILVDSDQHQLASTWQFTVSGL